MGGCHVMSCDVMADHDVRHLTGRVTVFGMTNDIDDRPTDQATYAGTARALALGESARDTMTDDEYREAVARALALIQA